MKTTKTNPYDSKRASAQIIDIHAVHADVGSNTIHMLVSRLKKHAMLTITISLRSVNAPFQGR